MKLQFINQFRCRIARRGSLETCLCFAEDVRFVVLCALVDALNERTKKITTVNHKHLLSLACATETRARHAHSRNRHELVRTGSETLCRKKKRLVSNLAASTMSHAHARPNFGDTKQARRICRNNQHRIFDYGTCVGAAVSRSCCLFVCVCIIERFL